MDLTRDNFDQYFPELEKAINECDFCAIDGEFTGVLPYKELNSFDTPKNRYEKMKKNSESYLLLQFGLCIFKKQEDGSGYESLAYNCYLYPKSSEKSKYCKSINFSCLSSSIEFLSEQNFDFNKVFSKGITYISKEHEEHTRNRIMQEIEENENNKKKPKPIAYPYNKPELKDEVVKIMSEIEVFMENEDESEKEVKLTDFLVRKFVEKNLRTRYHGKMKYESKAIGDNKEHSVNIKKINKESIHSDLADLEKEIGFSKLIWLLSKSNKLIIGHNIICDLLITLNHFFSSLPNQYEDFKVMAHSIFPNLLDTKYIASIPPLKELIQQTGLSDLHNILSEEPFKPVKIINCKYNLDSDKLHEAGFDAFLTGYCYIRMLNYLEGVVSNKQQSIIHTYTNKLHLMRTYDQSYMDIVNNQETPNRDNVFYLEFPPYWDDQDLFNLFEQYGKIFISWINKTSAFVALKTTENIKKVTTQLVGISGREYRVYFYKTYIHQLSKKEEEGGGNKDLIKKRSVENVDENLNGNKFAILSQIEDDKTETTLDATVKTKRVKIKEEKNKSLKKNEKVFDECMDWTV